MGKVNLKVVWALIKRDLRMNFTNPSGYVFITLFIFLSAAAAFWQARFFLNNLANLDRLNEVFPYLLLFFIPALTMSVWSEERKQGTDELLLTLPATDLEIVLGKYLAALGVYTASLVLSISHVLVLFWLGTPDLGLMFGNYLGYWLCGAALIAAGMVASMMTANTTIAFIFSALFCSVFVMVHHIGAKLSEGLGRALTPLSVEHQFLDFARGVVSVPGLVYFASVAGFLLYINMLLIGRRHWPREADGLKMPVHYIIRTAAIAIGLIAVNAIIGRGSARLDVTAEQLHSLSDETSRLIAEIDPDRPVFIQAFVSPEVPEHYVQTRENLLDALREISAEAGPRVQVLVEETEPFTQVARDARERFGIVPRQIPSLSSARASFSNVFLGVAVTCGPNEQVLPFLDRGLPVEYELARSIRVVAKTDRKKIGVVAGEIKLFGGLDFNTMRQNPAWSVVGELKKQYEVVQITPSSPITDTFDGLLVALPSALSQEEMDNVLGYIEKGNPTMLLIDPLPVIDLSMAPSERSGANRNPFMQQGQPPPKEKGDIEGFLARLGVSWNKGQVVWDSYNPHPDLAHLPEEVVFVGAGNQSASPFATDHRASASLQELVLLYPGAVSKGSLPDVEVKPLLSTGPLSGSNDFSELVRRSFLGASLNPQVPHRADPKEYTLAVHVKGKAGAAAKPAEDGAAEDDAASSDDGAAEGGAAEDEPTKGLDVIVIADLDFISEQFFAIRRTAPGTMNFDNVNFFLNAMDVLVGDESFIELRNRRVAHRTLVRVEEQTRDFIRQRAAEEDDAEAEAVQLLAEAQSKLSARVKEVRDRPDLNQQTKQIMARNLEEVESRRFEVQKANIESAKELKVQRSKEAMEMQIRKIQSGIRTFAVLLPPIPVFILGVWIFFRRRGREQAGAAAARRLRG